MDTDLYRHFAADGSLLYVGISLRAVGRLAEHKDRAPWAGDIARVDVERYPSRDAALEAERAAIHRERPVRNRARPVPAFVAVERIEANAAKAAYTVAELARVADRAVSTVEAAISAGVLETVRLAGRSLVKASSARDWLVGLAAMADSAQVTN